MIYHIALVCILSFNLCQAGSMSSKPREYEPLPSSHIVKIANEENLNERLKNEQVIIKLSYQEEVKKELHQEFVSTFADKSMTAEEIPRHIKQIFKTCLWRKIKEKVAQDQFNELNKNFLRETRVPRTQLIKLLLQDHPHALQELQGRGLIDAIPNAAVVPI